MAVKIKLKLMGKIRNPQYRIVIADSRTKRDGRAIEEIGLYHPKEEPSLIRVNSERVQYWLSVGAQPTEPVVAILKVTGDWQRFRGEPGAEGTLRVAEAKVDKAQVFNRILAETHRDDAPASPKRAAAPVAKAPSAAAPAQEAAAVETPAAATAEEPSVEAGVADVEPAEQP